MRPSPTRSLLHSHQDARPAPPASTIRRRMAKRPSVKASGPLTCSQMRQSPASRSRRGPLEVQLSRSSPLDRTGLSRSQTPKPSRRITVPLDVVDLSFLPRWPRTLNVLDRSQYTPPSDGPSHCVLTRQNFYLRPGLRFSGGSVPSYKCLGWSISRLPRDTPEANFGERRRPCQRGPTQWLQRHIRLGSSGASGSVASQYQSLQNP